MHAMVAHQRVIFFHHAAIAILQRMIDRARSRRGSRDPRNASEHEVRPILQCIK